MGVIKVRTLDKNLRKKGFVKEEGDHHFYVFYYKGLKTDIRTKISHSHDEIGDTLISLMAKDTRLDIREFKQFAKCTISELEYIKIQKKMGNL